MNPLLKPYITQISAEIDALETALEKNRTHAQSQKEAQSRNLKEYWALKSETAVLQDALQDHERLLEANHRHENASGALREGLRRILKYTDALAAEFRQ